MGFKTLREFNLAMLAKQAWRFHTNPSSLIAKVFKEKYYPLTDVLQAPIGCNPSYAWRSIQASLWVINKGSCWKIGDGSNINIWKDNWVPGHKNFKVFTPTEENSQAKTVNNLILSDPLRWDSEYLSNHFLSIDKEHIEQIPIISSNNKDELMWMFEPNMVSILLRVAIGLSRIGKINRTSIRLVVTLTFTYGRDFGLFIPYLGTKCYYG
jgi:hypothetical protein